MTSRAALDGRVRLARTVAAKRFSLEPSDVSARVEDIDRGASMTWIQRLGVLTVGGAVTVLLSAGAASAHVHKITPLRCTPAPANAGANQTDVTPASATQGGPISGVIPVVRSGGVVTLEGEGFDAAVCTH
jgi:hypothetical protein